MKLYISGYCIPGYFRVMHEDPDYDRHHYHLTEDEFQKELRCHKSQCHISSSRVANTARWLAQKPNKETDEKI